MLADAFREPFLELLNVHIWADADQQAVFRGRRNALRALVPVCDGSNVKVYCLTTPATVLLGAFLDVLARFIRQTSLHLFLPTREQASKLMRLGSMRKAAL